MQRGADDPDVAWACMGDVLDALDICAVHFALAVVILGDHLCTFLVG